MRAMALVVSLAAVGIWGCGKKEPAVTIAEALEDDFPKVPSCVELGIPDFFELKWSQRVCPPVYCSCHLPLRPDDPTEPMPERYDMGKRMLLSPGTLSMVEFIAAVTPIRDVAALHRFAREELHAEVTMQAPFVAIEQFPRYGIFDFRLLDNARWSQEEAMRKLEKEPWVIRVDRRPCYRSGGCDRTFKIRHEVRLAQGAIDCHGSPDAKAHGLSLAGKE